MAAKNSAIAKQPQNGNMQAVVYSETTAGPLPSAQQLEQYELIIPGAADRIITMAENQAKHRQELERIVVEAGARDSKMGVIFAFSIGIVTILSGVAVAIAGHEWPGVLLGTTGLGGLVSTFIYGTRSSREERAKKVK